ncbi:MAG: GNAT family N-acetyltransferase [Candidatus Eremiobacteraeota bacterium]|nr:GNAT family N-acetyltransferase [Candidatus Eremiobacteraeota bacterium]
MLETERTVLRTWTPLDATPALRIYGDAEVMRFIPVGVMDVEQITRLLARFNEEFELESFGLWAVIEKATGALLGECGLHRIPETGEVEIGWLFERACWGRGFASETARAILEYGFTTAKLRRIICLIDRENGRSVAVANRVGFYYDRIGRYYHRDLLKYYLPVA